MAEANNSVEPKNEGKKSSVNLLIIGLFSFLITVVVAGTFLVIVLKTPHNASDPAKQSAVSLQSQEQKAVIGPLVSVGPEIIVNITSKAGDEHFLKVNISLELQVVRDKKGKVDETGGALAAEVAKRTPQIRDTVITILRSKPKEKIDEKEGKDLIRSEIINTVNKFLISGRIKNVYFQDFVIQ